MRDSDLSVLVVEDNPLVRELIRETLDDEACEIREVETGPDALRAALEIRPQIVLLDLMLPGGLDGFEVCRQLRGMEGLAGARIAIVSARTQDEDIAKGMRAGADTFICKPFSPATLLGVFRRLASAPVPGPRLAVAGMAR